MTTSNIAAQIQERINKLDYAITTLKTEFVGLDEVIDRVGRSIKSWYSLPELIQRPVVINLWGMTGVGKTHLVRRLVQLLDFSDRFVEVQMDGFSAGNFSENTISGILSSSNIIEGTPGVLLLDEMQRYRTVTGQGDDNEIKRYQDVWMLLSDGKFSADASLFKDIEMLVADKEMEKQEDENEEEDEAPVRRRKKKVEKVKKYSMWPYEAKSLKKLLKLEESIQEIMTWNSNKIRDVIDTVMTSRQSWQLDYTKLLVFISGNLDEAFPSAANTDDCDTDADFYHELTKRMSVTDIKSVLLQRFRPEQISRFGNNHIIYPSMSRGTFEKIIHRCVTNYVESMTKVSEVKFIIDQSVYNEIYENGVYPTQGTRPVFSSAHMIFGDPLVSITLWALLNGYTKLLVSIDPSSSEIVATVEEGGCGQLRQPVELELRNKRKNATANFKALVAVHEAGHDLVYALLNGIAPFETKINTASFSVGYMLPPLAKASINTKQDVENELAVLLAGCAAEKMIFGENNTTVGSSSDRQKATELASHYVRKFGFGGFTSVVDGDNGCDVFWNTELEVSSTKIESILRNAEQIAFENLRDNSKLLLRIVDRLLEAQIIKQQEFIDLLPELMLSADADLKGFNFVAKLQQFKES